MFKANHYTPSVMLPGASKEGGCSLRRNLFLSRKQVAYKLLGVKGNLSGHTRVPRPLFEQDGSYINVLNTIFTLSPDHGKKF